MSTEIGAALSFVEGGVKFVVEKKHRIFVKILYPTRNVDHTNLHAQLQGESSDSAVSDSADVDRWRKHPNWK